MDVKIKLDVKCWINKSKIERGKVASLQRAYMKITNLKIAVDNCRYHQRGFTIE